MFGDSIYEFLIVLAVIFVAIDFFVASDVLSLIAYLLLSYVIVIFADLPILYGILLGIVSWFFIIFLHYTFFKNAVSKLCNKLIAKTIIPEEPMNHYIGQYAEVEMIDGKKLIRLDGDLVTFKNSQSFKVGDNVEIKFFSDGVLEVFLKSSSPDN